ncbi:MAG: complex I subunit 1 family protein [Polyangiaceae bacterium]
MNLGQIIWTAIKILIMVGFVVNMAAILTWYDRRGSAMMQDRIGPNRAMIKLPFIGELRIAGLLHTAADGVKFFFKEDFVPPNADKLLFGLAPILCMVPVIALTAVIPIADTLCTTSIWQHSATHFFGTWPAVERLGSCPAIPVTSAAGIKSFIYPVDGAIANIDSGVLLVFALAGQGIVGAAIAGWSSDNKFSLMGGLRAASQMVSYEVTMGLSLIGAFMIYGTVRLDDMVRWQGENAWGIFVQPAAFFLFFAAITAETKRIPFDLPEAESELVSGYFTEYSGMKFGMFYFAEYMEIVTSSMLLVTLFLGGWNLPFLHRDGLTIAFGSASLFHTNMPHVWMTIIGVATFLGKSILLCWFQAFVRWSLPRFRYDQLMKLGWRVLLPASLANIFITGIVYLAIEHSSQYVQSGVKLAGDISQGVVAALITFAVARMIFGMFKPSRHVRTIVGTSAEAVENEDGGTTKVIPMQA